MTLVNLVSAVLELEGGPSHKSWHKVMLQSGKIVHLNKSSLHHLEIYSEHIDNKELRSLLMKSYLKAKNRKHGYFLGRYVETYGLTEEFINVFQTLDTATRIGVLLSILSHRGFEEDEISISSSKSLNQLRDMFYQETDVEVRLGLIKVFSFIREKEAVDILEEMLHSYSTLPEPSSEKEILNIIGALCNHPHRINLNVVKNAIVKNHLNLRVKHRELTEHTHFSTAFPWTFLGILDRGLSRLNPLDSRVDFYLTLIEERLLEETDWIDMNTDRYDHRSGELDFLAEFKDAFDVRRQKIVVNILKSANHPIVLQDIVTGRGDTEGKISYLYNLYQMENGHFLDITISLTKSERNMIRHFLQDVAVENIQSGVQKFFEICIYFDAGPKYLEKVLEVLLESKFINERVECLKYLITRPEAVNIDFRRFLTDEYQIHLAESLVDEECFRVFEKDFCFRNSKGYPPHLRELTKAKESTVLSIENNVVKITKDLRWLDVGEYHISEVLNSIHWSVYRLSDIYPQFTTTILELYLSYWYEYHNLLLVAIQKFYPAEVFSQVIGQLSTEQRLKLFLVDGFGNINQENYKIVAPFFEMIWKNNPDLRFQLLRMVNYEISHFTEIINSDSENDILVLLYDFQDFIEHQESCDGFLQHTKILSEMAVTAKSKFIRRKSLEIVDFNFETEVDHIVLNELKILLNDWGTSRDSNEKRITFNYGTFKEYDLSSYIDEYYSGIIRRSGYIPFPFEAWDNEEKKREYEEKKREKEEEAFAKTILGYLFYYFDDTLFEVVQSLNIDKKRKLLFLKYLVREIIDVGAFSKVVAICTVEKEIREFVYTQYVNRREAPFKDGLRVPFTQIFQTELLYPQITEPEL